MPGNKRIVVVGGVAAGPKAAAKARRLDQQAEITIIQREPELSMATCGYPYYVGGHFNDRNALLSAGTGPIRNPAYFWSVKRITARTETEAVGIDREGKSVLCRDISLRRDRANTLRPPDPGDRRSSQYATHPRDHPRWHHNPAQHERHRPLEARS